MATWSRRERVTRVTEWVVPAPEPYGACWDQVAQAISQAEGELRETGRVAQGCCAPDDMIRVRCRDEEIVVYYETEEDDRG